MTVSRLIAELQKLAANDPSADVYGMSEYDRIRETGVKGDEFGDVSLTRGDEEESED